MLTSAKNAVEFTLDAEDVASARLLAIGIRPRFELALFVAALSALLAGSVSPWSFGSLPLLIGLTASLGAFRLMQIGKVKQTALAAYRRNPTWSRTTAACWDGGGVTIQPAGVPAERIAWTQLRRVKENQRIVLLIQAGSMHAIPKRAFSDKTSLAAFRALAGRPNHSAQEPKP
jgi:hypothetical protein